MSSSFQKFFEKKIIKISVLWKRAKFKEIFSWRKKYKEVKNILEPFQIRKKINSFLRKGKIPNYFSFSQQKHQIRNMNRIYSDQIFSWPSSILSDTSFCIIVKWLLKLHSISTLLRIWTKYVRRNSKFWSLNNYFFLKGMKDCYR